MYQRRQQNNSNTTLVKVKCKYPMLACRYAGYSNTTLVKVKFKEGAKWIIQKTIQIQHLLKLNHLRKTNKRKEYFIQIQHLLKLNFL